jgi:hypothetical protein
MSQLIPDGQKWHLYQGDCIPHMQGKGDAGGMPAESVDFAVFSPP